MEKIPKKEGRGNQRDFFMPGRVITEIEEELRVNQELSALQQIRLKRRLRRARKIRMVFFGIFLFSCVALIFGITIGIRRGRTAGDGKADAEPEAVEAVSTAVFGAGRDTRWDAFYELDLPRPELSVELLDFNDFSRPGIELPVVENVFIHYTANPGTSAAQNRNYFQLLGETGERSASAHFIIGIEGEIIQCIPTWEIAYAVMTRNYDSISIECCYEDENGIFTKATYESLLRLTAWLLHKFYLTPEDVLRHYDQGGKNCPKYYVENEQAWEIFLKDLTGYMDSLSEVAAETEGEAEEGME